MANLYIKFESEESGFDLVSLGSSLSGLDTVIRDLFEISQLQGELNIEVEEIKKGSIIPFLDISIISVIPFERIPDLLNFLFVTAPDYYKKAHIFFNEIGTMHRTANDFFNKYPLDMALSAYFASKFIPQMIKRAKKYKIAHFDKEIPSEYSGGLHKMIHYGRFKKLVSPIVEGRFKLIKISNNELFTESTQLDNNNFELYLPEEEQILPEWKNGQVVNITGEILALQCTRGELLRFKVDGIEEKDQLLVAHPAEDKQTEDYKDFYKKKVNIYAEVYRKSIYKKPELIIKKIELQQPKLI